MRHQTQGDHVVLIIQHNKPILAPLQKKNATDGRFWSAASDTWFQNIAPDAHQGQPDVTFLDTRLPDQASNIIFCDHESDMQYEAVYVVIALQTSYVI